jgi:hypothetical protein
MYSNQGKHAFFAVNRLGSFALTPIGEKTHHPVAVALVLAICIPRIDLLFDRREGMADRSR